MVVLSKSLELNGPSHCYDFSYDGPFQIRTILNQNFKKFGIWDGVRISAFGFWAVTIFQPENGCAAPGFWCFEPVLKVNTNLSDFFGSARNETLLNDFQI